MNHVIWSEWLLLQICCLVGKWSIVYLWCTRLLLCCCAAVYLAWHNDNQSGAHLVTAKTRLPPIKKEMTIPRLELTAARIAARLLKTVRETLKNWEPEELVLWSDSSTVLHWLENQGQYRQFVQRRVDEIIEESLSCLTSPIIVRR